MIHLIDTQVIKIDPIQPSLETLAMAAGHLQQGKLVAFPTETVYGLGANATDPLAINRIYLAKQRPATDPLIVHIADMMQLAEVAVHIPAIAWQLAEKFWPGPLTLILLRSTKIANNVSGGLSTVAVRMPDHPVPLSLIKAASLPVAAPSANIFMHTSPTTAQHVFEDLGGRVDLILDGGACPIGLESTVVDLLVDPPLILRPGGLTVEALRQIMPNVVVRHRYVQLSDASDAVESPGLHMKHYAPQARLLLVSGPSAAVSNQLLGLAQEYVRKGLSVGVLAVEEDVQLFTHLPIKLRLLGSRQDLARIGASLFAGLRALDKEMVDVILVGDPSQEGLGLAIHDRLVRAANGNVIEVS